MVNQCFICREWSWEVSRCWSGVRLCVLCYVDVLEVRQRRGAVAEPAVAQLGEGPDGQPPPDLTQKELFEPRERYR